MASIVNDAFVDRLPTARHEVILAGGDLTAIALFVAAGEVSHRRPLSAGLGTFLSFVVGWIVISLLVDAYGDRSLASPVRAVLVAGVAWIGAALLGQVIRAVAIPGATLAPAFVAVSLVAGGGIVVVWRALASFLLSPDRRP